VAIVVAGGTHIGDTASSADESPVVVVVSGGTHIGDTASPADESSVVVVAPVFGRSVAAGSVVSVEPQDAARSTSPTMAGVRRLVMMLGRSSLCCGSPRRIPSSQQLVVVEQILDTPEGRPTFQMASP
jgi:hypothetical protein